MNAQERLVEHAEAAKALAKARTELLNVRATLWVYTDKPGTRWSAQIGDAKWAAVKDKVRAAQARLNAAYVAYTDPFRVKPQNQNRVSGE